jgi:hypothetical protein
MQNQVCFACVFLLSNLFALPAAALESGKFIPVGTTGGRGPLAAPGVESRALGCARLSNALGPDLFVATGPFGHDRGLYRYPRLGTAEKGVPVFASGIKIAHPFGAGHPPLGTIVQTPDDAVHALWWHEGRLVHTRYDSAAEAFVEPTTLSLEGLPRSPSALGVVANPDGSFELLLGISDGTRDHPEGPGSRDPAYMPYDGRGIWRGGHPYAGLYAVTLDAIPPTSASKARLASPTDHEVRGSYQSLASVCLGAGHARDVLTGSRFGALYCYPNPAETGLALREKRHAVLPDGIAHRHPIINPGPIAYPNADTGYSDLIAGGEGALYYYRFSGQFSPAGKPIFEAPLPVLEENAALYGGSLAVVNVVDWDGDGAKDLVAGNSEGRVLFFKNLGQDAAPAIAPGVPVEAGGQPIHVQPGYRLDIQGPGEARWGYTCPAVADWNQDGLPDLLLSDSTARHTVFLNRGTRTRPELDAGRPLYYDDLDLYGTWRVKPAAALLAGHMAYVALDDDDQFHLYWQDDPYHVHDGGKLKLDDGRPIGANFLSAGGSGRVKINLVDWDHDGRTDLLLGTPRHASVPDPKHGLPQSLGLPGSAVLLLRNIGTDAQPIFALPELITFHGEPIFLGQHAAGPAPADFGNTAGLDLIVGTESGRFLYYNRKDLGTVRPEPGTRYPRPY